MKEIINNLIELIDSGKLKEKVVVWGMDSNIQLIIETLKKHNKEVLFITDNFKSDFIKEYMGIRICNPYCLKDVSCDFSTVFAVNHLETLKKQINIIGLKDVYNLRDLNADMSVEKCKYDYTFIERSKGRKKLCYILAGYEQTLWDTTISRVKAFQSSDFDYCILSSGKYDETLEKIAEENDWSYLYTSVNQVCYIQNLVINLHPYAEYIIKLDEDIFIGKNFFKLMSDGFDKVESSGEYRVGFVVPVLPLNCCGYVSYLKLIDKFDDFQTRFGKIYRSRFSNIFTEDKAIYLWDTISSFDSMAERFEENKGYNILNCYFNIGCIMFSRKRWILMGGWPESMTESGMGTDERYICQNGVDNDMVIYELKNVLAGHLAFGAQKACMLRYYKDYHEKFAIK